MARVRRARRRLSLTPLIDVIFLLLLFFMLTSSFSRFADVELSAGGAGQGADETTLPPLFLQVQEEALALNGEALVLERLDATLRMQVDPEAPQPVLVTLSETVTSQRLTDLLVVLNGVPGLRLTILGAS